MRHPKSIHTSRILEYFRTEDIELAQLVHQATGKILQDRTKSNIQFSVDDGKSWQKVPPIPKVPKVISKRTRRTKAQMAADKVVKSKPPADGAIPTGGLEHAG